MMDIMVEEEGIMDEVAWWDPCMPLLLLLLLPLPPTPLLDDRRDGRRIRMLHFGIQIV